MNMHHVSVFFSCSRNLLGLFLSIYVFYIRHHSRPLRFEVFYDEYLNEEFLSEIEVKLENESVKFCLFFYLLKLADGIQSEMYMSHVLCICIYCLVTSTPFTEGHSFSL